EVGQQEPVEGDLVAGEQAGDAAAGAEAVQGRAGGAEGLLVAAQQRAVDGDLGGGGVLDVDQLQVARGGGGDLFLGGYLGGVNVQLAGHQVAQGLLVAALVHEVAQHDDDALAGALEAEGAQGAGQVAGAGGLELVEEVQKAPQAAPAAHGGERLDQAVVEGLDDDAV